MSKKRLYRALRKNEKTLHSSLIEHNKLKSDISFLNEVYSHIVPSYTLRESAAFRTVFSFTEDINIARNLLRRYPNTYTSVGYVEVDIANAFDANHPDILFITPAFRLCDWVELMAYDQANEIKNLNYNRKVPLINAVIYSRWAAMSLAYTNREFLIICNHLTPLPIDDSSCVDTFIQPSVRDLLSKDFEKNIHVVRSLKRQLEPLQISFSRKKALARELDELLIHYQQNDTKSPIKK